MTDKWLIEYKGRHEFDFTDLTTAKRRARVIMRQLREQGDLLPFVQIIGDGEAWHYCSFARQWHQDTW